ncbi:MAG: hypothetical protein KBF83_04955 [Pyrinomonadaceae bacterium]|nr:hypothetical protein [Pyrinomonadaceae bacterium]
MKVIKFSLIAFFVLTFGVTPNLFSQAPLAYSISLLERNRDKKTLTFKTTIKNISTKDVIIDKTGNYRLDVRKFGKLLPNGFSTTDEFASINSHGHSPDYLRLPPKGTFTNKRILPLTTFTFFEKKRLFAISFTYGQFGSFLFEDLEVWKGTVKSNTVKLRL